MLILCSFLLSFGKENTYFFPYIITLYLVLKLHLGSEKNKKKKHVKHLPLTEVVKSFFSLPSDITSPIKYKFLKISTREAIINSCPISLHFLSQFTLIHKFLLHKIHCFELSIGAYFPNYLIEPTVIKIWVF